MTFNTTMLKNRISMLLLAVADLFSLMISLYTVVIIRKHILSYFSQLPPFTQSVYIYIWLFPLFIILFAYKGIYSKTFSFWDEIKESLKSIVISYLIILLILFTSKKSSTYSRIVITFFTLTAMFIVPMFRIYVRKILFKSGFLIKKTLIIGSSSLATEIYKAICLEPNLCYCVAGFIDDSDIREIDGIKVYRNISKVERYISFAHITDVIIAKEELDANLISQIINRIQHKVENVIYIPQLKNISVYGTEIKYFFSSQVIGFEVKNNLSNPFTYMTKRITDYILTIMILPVVLPIMIVLAVLVKKSSPGPIFYSHTRIGKNGKEFKCYKFRTMYIDADKRLKEILEKDPIKKKEWETYWKLKDDPRVTKIGKFLRKTSLDELPQIFNILKGEMSLVGPRPVIRKEIEDYYQENAYFYFLVPPGITGLWQVSGRSNTSYDYRVSLDSWYVKNWNLWLDIVILFKTIKAVIKREGAC